MTTLEQRFASEMTALRQRAPAASRWLVAFSGGLDSTVLLHLIAKTSDADRPPVLAVHVDHQLHEQSGEWSEHCGKVAAQLNIEYRQLTCAVVHDGSGPEAAARDARYSALGAIVKDGDWLLTAHHGDDQAETLLLNLMRGSGPDGIAGIASARSFATGWLLRPLLAIARSELQAYGQKQDLRWIEDPSNDDTDLDRNFMRHDVLPLLESRWPNATSRLLRSARHARDASSLLREIADADLKTLQFRSGRLPIDGLMALSAARQRNAIRAAIRAEGLNTPSSQQLETIRDECIAARQDAQPLVRWPGASARRYRNALYLLPEKLPTLREQKVQAETEVSLGRGLGSLQFRRVDHSGLSPALFERGLELRMRRGGEEIKPIGQAHTHKLKKLLQDEGIVPWMRDRLPLLYCGEHLVAVGDVWLAADAVEKPGIAVHWNDPPALH